MQANDKLTFGAFCHLTRLVERRWRVLDTDRHCGRSTESKVLMFVNST